jgi:hypothetical protein
VNSFTDQLPTSKRLAYTQEMKKNGSSTLRRLHKAEALANFSGEWAIADDSGGRSLSERRTRYFFCRYAENRNDAANKPAPSIKLEQFVLNSEKLFLFRNRSHDLAILQNFSEENATALF